MAQQDADASEDVNDFLVRIRELGDKRDKEDEERTRKLEEEILQGRRERQARRAERARSISPIKDSPTPLDGSIPLNDSPSHSRSQSIDPPFELLPSLSFTPLSSEMESQNTDATKPEVPLKKKSFPLTKPAIDSDATPLSRTLSWKQRPSSRDSVAKPSNSNKSPDQSARSRMESTNSEAASAEDGEPQVSRTQIAQSLGSKDPAWFKQTSGRANESRAYRKSHNSTFSESTVGGGNIKLPGLSRESTSDLEATQNPDAGGERSRSPSRTSSVYGASSFGNRYSSVSTVSTGGLGSPVPLSAHKLESRPPSIYENPQSADKVTMSPSQGRISNDRPASPTKGLGGFVQSAMLKRSDSVSKRWSAQSGPNVLRGNITPISRNESPMNGSSQQTPVARPETPSEENGFSSNSRPGSSHSEMTVVRNNAGEERPSYLESTRTRGESVSHIGLSRPVLPPPSSSRRSESISTGSAKDFDLPVSPSKTMDPKRWSPTKASWLESALSKPDSPKLKASTAKEPEWKRDLTERLKKAKGPVPEEKETNSDVSPSVESPKIKEPEKPIEKPGAQNGEPTTTDTAPETPKETKKSVDLKTTQSTPTKVSSKSPPIPLKSDILKSDIRPSSRGTEPSSALTSPVEHVRRGSVSPEKSSFGSPTSKGKDNPALDLRANLRPRKHTNSASSNQEPEFKAVFGKLRRAETKNYVPPDELKNNILKGKAALANSGGPQKTQRVDEFKDDIQKRKLEMKSGGGSIRKNANDRSPEKQSSASSSPVPEAIARRNNLSRSESNLGITPNPKPATLRSPSQENISTAKPDKIDTEQPKRSSSPVKPQSPPPVEKQSPTKTIQPVAAGKGTLAGRLNPALAGLLARGPSSDSNTSPKTSSAPSPSQSSPDTTSKTLTHMTKSRARGPKRRLPQKTKRTSPEKKEEKKPSPVSPPATERQLGLGERNLPGKPQSPSQSSSVKVTTAPPLTGTKTAAEPTKTEEKNTFSRPSVKDTANNFRQSNDAERTRTSGEISIPKRSSERELSSKVDAAGRADSNTRRASKPKPNPPSKPSISIPSRPSSATHKVDSPQTSQKTPVIPTPEKKPYLNEAKPVIRNKPESISPLPSPSESEIRSSKPVESPPVPSKSAAINSIKLARPASMARGSPFPQSSEATRIFNGFFDTPPSASLKVQVDPESILLSKQQGFPKIKTLKKQVWELSGDGKRKDLPPSQEYILFEESMYLCVHGFEKDGKSSHTEVHLWCGDGVGEATLEDVQLFAKKVARENNCKLEVLKQGKETTSFIQALGGIIVTRRGSSNRAGSSNLYMLCGRRHMGQISFDEVDLSPASLCSGYPFIISAKFGKLYLWQGKGSTADELGCARLIGMDIGLTGEIEEVTEGQEPSGFFDVFPDRSPRPAFQSSDKWRLKPNHNRYCCRLFRVDHELGQRSSFWNRRGNGSPVARPNDTVQEIETFCQRDLDAAHIYVLDAFFEIYVIVGERAHARSAEFATALVFAQEYGILAVSEQDRPSLPQGSVILNGLPDECKRAFRKWDDKLSWNRGIASHVLPLGAAIDSIR